MKKNKKTIKKKKKVKNLTNDEKRVGLHKALFGKEKLLELSDWESEFLTNIWETYYKTSREDFMTVKQNQMLNTVLLKYQKCS